MKQILTIMMLLFIGFHNPVEENLAIEISGTVVGADDGLPLPQVTVMEKGTNNGVATDKNGQFKITIKNTRSKLLFRYLGYVSQDIRVKDKTVINVRLEPDIQALGEVVVTGYGTQQKRSIGVADMAMPSVQFEMEFVEEMNFFGGENYAEITENGFRSPWKNALSTFSIDVDAAAYSNVRRFLNMGQMPPKDAVKIEEMINYFDYNYEEPK